MHALITNNNKTEYKTMDLNYNQMELTEAFLRLSVAEILGGKEICLRKVSV